MILAKYGSAFTIELPIVKAGSSDYAASGDWTPATGDVKVSKDGGAVANITTLPTAVTGTGSILWTFSLSATEMQAAIVTVQVVDSATKAVEDLVFSVQTYGNASANVVSDLDGLALEGADSDTLETLSDQLDAVATAAALSTAQADLDTLTGTDGATLATTQANYAPSTHSAADVWAVGTRTLTSFGTLVADVWAALTSGLVTVGSIGKLLVDNVDAAVSSRSSHSAADVWTAGSRELSTPNNYKADVSGLATSAALATAQADLDIITGASGAVLDDDAITAAKFDETTAFPIKSADAASTQIARVGADGDTLETLSDQIDGITPSDPAAVVTALMADTSCTSAGTVTFANLLNDIHSGMTGKWTATINGDSTVTLAYFDNDSPAVERYSFTVAANGLSGTPV